MSVDDEASPGPVSVTSLSAPRPSWHAPDSWLTPMLTEVLPNVPLLIAPVVTVEVWVLVLVFVLVTCANAAGATAPNRAIAATIAVVVFVVIIVQTAVNLSFIRHSRDVYQKVG
jgi:hypothetical protein